MKIILVDAVNTFVVEENDKYKIFPPMFELLESFKNRKIILTNADDEQMQKFGLRQMPYEVFTLKHDPEKTDPKYFKIMLEYFNLSPGDVVYFEHKPEAVLSAQSYGIKAFHYNKDMRDLVNLKNFLNTNLC